MGVYVLGLEDVLRGMRACGYKHTIKHSNRVYMQLHNSFSHTLYTNAASVIHLCRPGEMLWQSTGHE